MNALIENVEVKVTIESTNVSEPITEMSLVELAYVGGGMGNVMFM